VLELEILGRTFERPSLDRRRGERLEPCGVVPFAIRERVLEAQDRIVRNPMRRIAKRKAKKQVVYDIYSDEEHELLTSLPAPDGALMHVLLDTGLRKGEARNLQWRHVQLDEELLVVYGGKGGKDRIIPLTDACRQALAQLSLLEGLKPDDYLWYGLVSRGRTVVAITRSRPIGEARFHNWYAASVGAAGVRYRKPHICRHTFATMLLRAGCPIEMVADYLGHESVDTTRDTYRHLNVEDMRLGIELMNRARRAREQSIAARVPGNEVAARYSR